MAVFGGGTVPDFEHGVSKDDLAWGLDVFKADNPDAVKWIFNDWTSAPNHDDLGPHSGKNTSTDRTASGSSGADVDSAQQLDGKENGRKKGARISRWKQSKSKMGVLEQEAAEKKALVLGMERENQRLKFRKLAMEHTLAAREKQVAILMASKQLRAAKGVQNDAIDGPCLSALAGKLREFVSRASMVLLEVPEVNTQAMVQNPTPMEMLLGSMVQDFCNEMGRAFVLNPHMQFEMMTHRADQVEAPAMLPEPAHWDYVATEIRASSHQVQEVAACWELNGATMMKLQQEVSAARTELSLAVAQSLTVRTSELQTKLAAAIINQGMACRVMGFILFGRILTPVQTSLAIVNSFPYFPNIRELVIRLLATNSSRS